MQFLPHNSISRSGFKKSEPAGRLSRLDILTSMKNEKNEYPDVDKPPIVVHSRPKRHAVKIEDETLCKSKPIRVRITFFV